VRPVVDDGALAGQGRVSTAARKAVRELAAVLRKNDDGIASFGELAAVPVEFHVVKPRLAGGWSDTQ
jgi:hypothetical protein